MSGELVGGEQMPVPYLAQDVAASCLEISGTFLLAVEAIKLDNLRRFREVVLGGPLRWLTPRVWVSKNASEQDISAAIERRTNQFLVFLGVVGGLCIVAFGSLTGLTLGGLWSAFRSTYPDSVLVTLFVGFLFFYLGIFLCLLIGLLLYTALILPFRLPIRMLEFIEARTASGGIGIVGFGLFFVGALIHIWIKVAA
jgi:hypothetical protein